MKKKLFKTKAPHPRIIINIAKCGRRVARNSQLGGGTGVWGRSPQRLKNLHFFSKIT